MSHMESVNKWDLNRIVFIGRVWDEYSRMFDLTQEELVGRKVLDCPAGACSFTAASNQLGLDVTACDMAYYHLVEELYNKGLQDIETTMVNMEKTEVEKNFIWHYFKSVDELRQIRTKALNECILDMKHNQKEKRYIPAVLPNLPFEDKQFDLTLSANLLFLYDDKLDYQFHLQTIREFMRVTKDEIRVFPTTNFSCERYQYLDKLVQDLHHSGWTAEEIRVPYEFQKNTNRMLRIKRMV
jgi:hypothetical protein